jgi:ribosomal protein S12 methylthiotransferase
MTVLVDSAGPDGAVARSASDAPEIDGSVLIADGQSLKPGQFVDVVVETATEHDLHARLAHSALKIV